jgi:hypothetical protein
MRLVLGNVTIMFRFPTPLTPAAKYLMAYSLKVASEEWPALDADPEDWAENFPLFGAHNPKITALHAGPLLMYLGAESSPIQRPGCFRRRQPRSVDMRLAEAP